MENNKNIKTGLIVALCVLSPLIAAFVFPALPFESAKEDDWGLLIYAVFGMVLIVVAGLITSVLLHFHPKTRPYSLAGYILAALFVLGIQLLTVIY